MKIRSVTANNRSKEFSVTVWSGATFSFPYGEADPQPDAANLIEEVFVDKELAKEAFSYTLKSGEEGSVHIEQILEYNEDPKYLSDLLTYKLTLEAKHQIEISGLSRRQVARRLKTSVPQLYRLLDPSNTRKSMNQLVALLHILNCDIDLVVTKKDAA